MSEPHTSADTSRQQLRALAERVAKASGPDTDLDYDIQRTLAGPGAWTTDREYYPPITSSIDSALALVERVLPNWQGIYLTSEWTGIKRPGNGEEFSCTLRRGIHSYVLVESNKRPSFPLAILSALIVALLSEAAHD
jgi:hypothetical protein